MTDEGIVEEKAVDKVAVDKDVVDTDSENAVEHLQTAPERNYRMNTPAPQGKENKLIAINYLGTWLPEARCRVISPPTPKLGSLTDEERDFYSNKYVNSTCRPPTDIRPMGCSMSAGIQIII